MAFNIGATEEVSIVDLQNRIFELVESDPTWKGGLPEVQLSEGYHGDAGRRLPDVILSQANLGWVAQTTLSEGLALMWAALRS
jgi:nucleoside-diphosphate-sugar epimerase